MKKAVIGLSGGVDSAVAAALLKNEYDLTGVTLRLQGDCFDLKDIADAEAIARRIGIPHVVLDGREQFASVKNYFADAYLHGKTPNPCIFCNPTMKWKMLLEYADSIGAEFVATGHYAFVEQLENGRYTVRTADSDKDQTYALCMLSQEQLARTLMPLGKYAKEDVRAKARELGFEISDKPDSMEICFVRDNDYAGYIEDYTGQTGKEGNFVDREGNILGRHRGILHYTVGQRKGLGIAFGKPMFVRELRPESNEVVLGENEELFAGLVEAEQLHTMGTAEIMPELCGIGKIRYSHKGERCSIISSGSDRMLIRFENPVRAATPGQAVVIYDEAGHILCSGIIRRSLPEEI